MTYASLINDTWAVVTGAFTDASGTNYPADWLNASTPQWRTAHGIFRIAEADEVPAGQRITGTSLVDRGGRPAWVHDLEPIPMEEARAGRLADLAALRWQRQQTFAYRGGLALADDVTIGRIVAKVFSAQLTGAPADRRTLWKFGPDNFAEVTVAELVAYGAAIDAHVQGCFDREGELAAQLREASDYAEVVAVDITAGWPA